jgi:1-phosphofructokinase family hexose kinase
VTRKTLVLALHPALDVEWLLDEVRPWEKNEVHSERRWPGGKGVNVARWLRWLGGDPTLFIPLGGLTGQELLAGLRGEKLRSIVFPLREPSRINVIVTPKRGPQLRLNQLWPRFSAMEQRSVVATAKTHVARAPLTLLSGALPRTLPRDTYARLVRHARVNGRRVILDCDGEPFARALPERPFLVKPNQFELGQWHGRPLRTEAAVRRAALNLSGITSGWVLVSRGGDGALLVKAEPRVVLSARAPKVALRNTVGAGDAMLAAVAHQITIGAAPEEWLHHGVATGTAATQIAPGKLPSRQLVHQFLGALQRASTARHRM